MKKHLLTILMTIPLISTNIAAASDFDYIQKNNKESSITEPLINESFKLNNSNIISQMNTWGLPIDDYKNSDIKVHDILILIEPIFDNLPNELITDNGIIIDGENARHYSILKNMLLTSSGETAINILIKQYVFTLLDEANNNTSSTVDQRLLTDMDSSSDTIYNYYNSFLAFSQTNNLKIEINYDVKITSGEKDSNINKSKLYSIINNAPFILKAPEKFSEGIFNKSDSVRFLINNKFNIENYENNDFLSKKILFNNIYFGNIINNINKFKSKEIKGIFPIVYNNPSISEKGIFVDGHKYYETTIHINNTNDIENIKTTYFLLDSSYNIKVKNVDVFVLSNYANISTLVSTDEVTIYPLNSSIRTSNLNNDLDFKNRIIVSPSFTGRIETENNPNSKSTVNIILPDTFNELFVYDFVNNHLFIKNQKAMFKITKNTILSFKDNTFSYDQLKNAVETIGLDVAKYKYMIFQSN